MEYEKNKFRSLILSDTVKPESTRAILKDILEINVHDRGCEAQFKDYTPAPIVLVINSFGGSIYDGLALVDAIRNSQTPVHTHCYGAAMSMAFWIFLAGHKRFAGRYATFMYHEITVFDCDRLTGLKKDIEEYERLQGLYDSFILAQTHICQEKLDKFRESKSDWYIAPEEALKLNICESIL